MAFVPKPVVSLASLLGVHTVLEQTAALRKYLQSLASDCCQL